VKTSLEKDVCAAVIAGFGHSERAKAKRMMALCTLHPPRSGDLLLKGEREAAEDPTVDLPQGNMHGTVPLASAGMIEWAGHRGG